MSSDGPQDVKYGHNLPQQGQALPISNDGGSTNIPNANPDTFSSEDEGLEDDFGDLDSSDSNISDTRKKLLLRAAIIVVLIAAAASVTLYNKDKITSSSISDEDAMVNHEDFDKTNDFDPPSNENQDLRGSQYLKSLTNTDVDVSMTQSSPTSSLKNMNTDTNRSQSMNSNSLQAQSIEAKTESNASLPRWNLGDMYSGLEDPAIAKDYQDLGKIVESLFKFKGKITKLSPTEMLEFLSIYENLSNISHKLSGFAFLSYSVNSDDQKIAAFYGSTQRRLSEILSSLAFLRVEMSQLKHSYIQEITKISSQDTPSIQSAKNKLQKYKFFLYDATKYQKHTLSEETEIYAIKKATTSSSNWLSLYEKAMAQLRFTVDDKEYTFSELSTIAVDEDRAKRKMAADELSRVLQANSYLFTSIYNSVIQDKATEDDTRKYKNSIASRNLDNSIEDSVIDALIEAVKQNYATTSHRYYGIKKKILGLDKMMYYDIFAPIPKMDRKHYSWEEARTMVISAYNDFSPAMSVIAQKFFENKWIDAPMDKYKQSGAFCHSGSTGGHPYVLLNYDGKARSVFTLAHELGHGIHFYLSNSMGPLLAATPLTMAETASIFGEHLLFKKIMQQTKSVDDRIAVLVEKIDDILATVVRQISFVEFEKNVHAQSKKGILTFDEIGKIWVETQKAALGPEVQLDDNVASRWIGIWHFFGVPFYVYAYSFGQLLVSGLIDAFESKKAPDFPEQYVNMLSKGGSLYYRDMLRPFNIDASKVEFWQTGMKNISGMIDQLEKLLEERDNLKQSPQPQNVTTPDKQSPQANMPTTATKDTSVEIKNSATKPIPSESTLSVSDGSTPVVPPPPSLKK